MHKELLLLGLLQSGPKTGYDLHRVVVAHGELYTDLKKGNVYYLLERMADAGHLQVETEPGARGPRRERLIYSLTEQGRQHFVDLLREVVRTYELAHTGVEVGMVFLPSLAPEESIPLLEERRRAVIARRSLVEHEARAADPLHTQLAHGHLLCIMDAELAWIDRAIQGIRRCQTEILPRLADDRLPPCPGQHATEEG
jgi:DNA-binding PadR family transcriptional regulator